MEIARGMVAMETPYVHAGRSALNGVDCVGVITVVCDEIDYAYTDLVGYSRQPDGKLVDRIAEFGDEVSLEDMKPGDVAVFWVNPRHKKPQHVALIVDGAPLGMVHCHRGVGRVVENTLDASWRKRIIKVFRFRGMED